jgi:hypothetical protein
MGDADAEAYPLKLRRTDRQPWRAKENRKIRSGGIAHDFF